VTAVGLSLMPEPEFAAATLPLFEDGLVDVVEWSFDMGWGPSGVPDWVDVVLDEYAEAGQLDGHGVSFSLLSQHPRQEWWLEALAAEVRRRPYRRVSEHVGFMAAGDIARSSPLPMPHHPDVVRRARLQAERLSTAAGSPIGLENLATSLSRDDAVDQGALCASILGPVDGWMVLDLHNLWCQAVNFGLTLDDLLSTYPRGRLREVHVSGGSWWTAPGNPNRVIRRDTHDGPIPDEVLTFLPTALRRCPDVDTVIVERVGTSFGGDGFDPATAAVQFQADFLAVRAACGAAS
jgi:uncharacterized protein (UPF0276 family)